MPTAPLESASGRRCVRSASVQNVGKLSAFRWEYQMCRSPSSVLLQPTGRKTDVSKLGQPKSRRFAEKTRNIVSRPQPQPARGANEAWRVKYLSLSQNNIRDPPNQRHSQKHLSFHGGKFRLAVR